MHAGRTGDAGHTGKTVDSLHEEMIGDAVRAGRTEIVANAERT